MDEPKLLAPQLRATTPAIGLHAAGATLALAAALATGWFAFGGTDHAARPVPTYQ